MENEEVKSLFGGQNYLFNTEQIDEQHRKVQIFNALKSVIIPDDLYEKTGLKLLLTPLLKSEKLNPFIKGGFIEFSTIASTLHDDQLDAFNLSFFNFEGKNAYTSNILNDNVSKYFKTVISKLRNNNLILFNHPDFTIRPNKILNFISIINGDDEIYPKNFTGLINKKYSEITANPLEPQEEKGQQQTDNISGRTYRIFIRKSNLKDVYTTFEGLTERKSMDVKNEVEQEFGTLTSTDEKLFATHFLNHKLYHSEFQKDIDPINPSIFISIPILDPHPHPYPDHPNLDENEEDLYIGLGAVFIFLLLDDSLKDFENFKKELQKYCSLVPGIVRSYLSGYIFQIGVEKLKLIKRETTKSAIAAIMSRNMSHNIGSHVLVKLSETKNVTSENDVAEFNQYLKHRMSFIADLSTSQSSVSGLSFINNGILEKFRNLKLLKNHISGNDSINADNIKLNYICNIPGFSKEDDVAIQIPTDVIGKQAIYVFIENFIRNAVKYSIVPIELKEQPGFETTEEYTLCINICLSQPDQDELRKRFYVIDIFDCSSIANFENRSELVPISEDKGGKQFKVLKKLQDEIDRPLLENGAPRIGGWGILEMKICAAFLRKQSLYDIDNNPSERESPNILTAHFFKIDGTGKFNTVSHVDSFSEQDLNLGYKFYLLKPKKIGFSNTGSWVNISDNTKSRLELFGIYFVEINEEIISSGLDFEMLVLDKTSSSLTSIFNSGTQRGLILYDEEKIEKIRAVLNVLNISTIENLVWEYYCDQQKYFGDIRIYQNTDNISFHENAPSNLIIFDHHGEHAQEVCNIIANNNSLLDSPVFYYEKFGSESGTSSVIDENRSNLDDNVASLSSKFKEIAHIEIIVIDERIQRAAYSDTETIIWSTNGKRSTKSVPLNELLQKMRIWVPDIKQIIDLDKQSFNKTEDTDLLSIENWIEAMTLQHPIKFVLIHLSIIEKLKNTDPDSIKFFYKRWRDKWGDKLTIVIISGRGQPSTIPDGSYFIPYDCIEEYLLRNRSKFNLVNLIYSTNMKN